MFSLDFTQLFNDDNVVQVNLFNRVTGNPQSIVGASVAINIYAAGNATPVLSYVGVLAPPSAFQFTIKRVDVAALPPAHYNCVAIVTYSNGTRRTANQGDIDMSTGLIQIIGRPPT
jgi:hypothetical protein